MAINDDDKAYAQDVEVESPVQNFSDFVRPEPTWSKYIPGGYSPKRCLRLSGRPMLTAILALAGTCIMFFGYDAAVMSIVNINPDYLEHMDSASGSHNDAARVGGLVSFWYLGFAIGAICCGLYADSIGRLKCLELGCVWGLLGAALLATAENFSWMACARIISGIGCGHLNTIAPIWTSELADYNLRGTFVAVQFTLCILGIAGTFWMEYACLQLQSLTFAWRFPLGFQGVFLILILIIVPFYPETPRHLAQTGRVEEAREILTRCRVNATEEKISLELLEIQDAIRIEATQSSHGFFSMIWKKDQLHTRRRVALAMGIQFMQKLTGADVVAIYGPQIFALSGFSGNSPVILAGCNFFGYALGLAISTYTIERVGRRKLLLTGLITMGIMLIISGGLTHEVFSLSVDNPGKAKTYGKVVVALVYLFTFTYGTTWLATTWVYPTEVFPLATRAKGVALATVSFSVAGAFIDEIIPYMIAGTGFWVFIMFAFFNFGMLVIVWCFYVETADRHLEDLDILFASDSPLAYKMEREFDEKKRLLGLGRAEGGVILSETPRNVPLRS